MDRRREAWCLRLSGWTYKAIGEKLGVSQMTVHADCKIAQEHFEELALRQEIVREGLMQIHGKLNGMLMQTLQKQLEEGQLVTELDKHGNIVKITRKNWPNTQLAGELGRNLQRMAALAGLDTAPVEGGSSSNTTIVLSQPNDGVSFEDRWKNAAPTAGAVDVSATSANDDGNATPALESAAGSESTALDVTALASPADAAEAPSVATDAAERSERPVEADHAPVDAAAQQSPPELPEPPVELL